MKKLLLTVALLILFACGPIQDQAESTVSMGTPDGYAVSCVTGYVRTLPHFCALNGSVTPTLFTPTLDSTCRSVNLTASIPTLPISSRYVQAEISLQINGNSAVASRLTSVAFYTDSSCTQLFWNYQRMAREEVATALALTIMRDIQMLPVTSQLIYYNGLTTGGAGSVFSFSVVGYYD